MTEIQGRLWGQMIQHLRDYDHRSLSFQGMVCVLKKTMEAAGFPEGEFERSWKEVWKPLEDVVLENPSADVDPVVVQPMVEHMRTYLLGLKETPTSRKR